MTSTFPSGCDHLEELLFAAGVLSAVVFNLPEEGRALCRDSLDYVCPDGKNHQDHVLA